MRTVVWTGSRGWTDVGTVVDAVNSLRKPFRSIVGGAKGFDSIVEQVLDKQGLFYLRFDAYWERYGKAAGHKRNDLMLDWLLRLDKQGRLISGWDGSSPGTKGCIEAAIKRGIDHWPLAYCPNGR